MRASRCRFVLLILAVACVAPWRAGATQPDFQALLSEAGARFTAPDGYRDAAVPGIEGFRFDKSFRDPQGGLQVAYAVRPLSRMKIDYNDPHSSAPNPNHIFPLVFGALGGQLSAGGHAPVREFPAGAAKKRFNADWASATTFDLEPQLSGDFRYGFLLAMHRNNKGDIYALFMYSDPATAKQRIGRLLANLSFDPAP
jgi:hypothetical protein